MAYLYIVILLVFLVALILVAMTADKEDMEGWIIIEIDSLYMKNKV